eukprot:scaffold3337_cov67-Phaeocystis_antarctica.AAC.6
MSTVVSECQPIAAICTHTRVLEDRPPPPPLGKNTSTSRSAVPRCAGGKFGLKLTIGELIAEIPPYLRCPVDRARDGSAVPCDAPLELRVLHGAALVVVDAREAARLLQQLGTGEAARTLDRPPLVAARARDVPRADEALESEGVVQLGCLGAAAGVDDDLAVLDLLLRAALRLHLAVAQLTEPLESQAEGPHELAMAGDDHAAAREASVDEEEECVDALHHLCERLAAGRCPEERLPPPPRLVVLEGLAPLQL